MPRANNRSYNSNSRYNNDDERGSGRNSNRGSRQSSRGKDSRTKFTKVNDFNMVGFGHAFLDETTRDKYEFKARLGLKAKEGKLINVFNDDKSEEYEPEEAVQLLAKALLEGRMITICYFPNDDGSWSGNARINVQGLSADDEDDDEEEEPVKPAKKAKAKPAAAKAKAKPKYEVTESADDEDDDEEETIVDETDDDELAY